MNYIYDLVLNFFDYKNTFEFYEWSRDDKFTYIEKIPIYKVNPMQMKEICYSKIVISKEILSKIKNNTVCDSGIIPYSLLVTDYKKVVALKFDVSGELVNKSYLLLDEEDAVIDECSLFDLEYFEYEVISKFKNNTFFTRREKYIKNYLLNEITMLYKNKKYDEIDYLYYELYRENDTIYNKYTRLIDDIEKNYSDKFNTLYDIIELSKQGILNN